LGDKRRLTWEPVETWEKTKEHTLIRKLLVVATAIAIPLSVVAATGATAGAKAVKPPPDPAVTCSISATITFAPPGISNSGAISTSKTSVTTTTGETFGTASGHPTCSGSAPNLAISSKSTKCDKKVAGQPSSNPACEPGFYGYDSWQNFQSGGVASVQKSLKNLSFTINGITYATKTTSAAIDGSCANSEVGFLITGTVKAPKNDKGQTDTLSACLGTVTGPGVVGSPPTFTGNLFGPGTVATAQIDPATSTISVG
jgi:hypothetical protein